MNKVLNFFKFKFTQFLVFKSTASAIDYKKRAHFMGGIFSALLVFILIRYAWITFFPTQLREKLVDAGTKQFETSITLDQPRAVITDRNGRPLAVSIPSSSLFLLAKKMPKDLDILEKVSKKIDVPLPILVAYSKQRKGFIWLKRQMSHAQVERIGSLKQWQDFIGIVYEPKRIYPEKDIAAQLIGMVGSDGNGLEGIEKIYNERLRAKPIKVEVLRDARGNYVISKPGVASKPDKEVANLALSIDTSIQEFTQSALKDGVVKAKAKGGSAIVMDVKTGEILAMGSYPSFDLNDPPENNPEARRFRPIMDAIELGSVVKPMWVAKALDMGVINPSSKIFAENGKMAVPGGFIHDTHEHGFLTPEEILKFSSNIGAYKVVQKIGKEEFYKSLMLIGFGRQPGTGLPGEWGGRIQKPQNWREMRFANMAFGQGFAISPLQLIHGLSIIVGGGVDRGVNLLKINAQQEAEFIGPPLRYIREDTSRLIAKMMETVVEEPGSTGSPARIPGVLVAGKTGTAQIWSTREHSYSGRTPVFEGIIPADDPKIAIVVVVDEAGIRPAQGGPVSGPIFAEIGRKTIDYLNSRGFFSVNYYENQYLKKPSSSNTLRE